MTAVYKRVLQSRTKLFAGPLRVETGSKVRPIKTMSSEAAEWLGGSASSILFLPF